MEAKQYLLKVNTASFAEVEAATQKAIDAVRKRLIS
jgi:hypothetical protein